MIALDRDALLCDLAETYGVYDLRAVPVSVLATLAVGLRDESRIMMKLNGERLTKTEMLLAAAIDRLSVLIWQRTENGHNGINPPSSLLDKLLGVEETESGTVQSFDTPEDFEREWEKITGVKHGR